MKLTGFNQPTAESLIDLGQEAWRFSNLVKHLPLEITPAKGHTSGQADVTFLGGSFTVGTLPPGVALQATPAFTALATQDDMAQLPLKHAKVLELHITKTLDRPLRLSVVRFGEDEAQATLAGIKIQVHPGVKASILQECQGSATGLTTQTIQVHLGAQAQLDHAIIVREGADALHVASFDYKLETEAELRQTVLGVGGKMTRMQLGVTLSGENARAHVASLNALTGKSHTDFHSQIRHEVGRTYSVQKAKNFLDGESKGIFTGRIHILPQAQLVEAQQMNRNLLLSKKAHALGQPQLEIYADDVKCAHGSSTGQVEEEATFYLESRGISPKRTQELLAQAFVQEVFTNSQDPILTQAVESAFRGRV